MTKLLPGGLCFGYALELPLNTVNSINYALTSSMELSFTMRTETERENSRLPQISLLLVISPYKYVRNTVLIVFLGGDTLSK